MIGGFQSIWCASVFQGLLCDNFANMIDGSKKCNSPIFNRLTLGYKTWWEGGGGVGGQNKRNVLFIAEPQDDSFVLFPQASEPSMNFHILKLVYCKLDFKFQSSDVIESAVSYFTLFCSKIKSLEPA